MKTSYPFPFAALKMRSIFSTVLFSVTLWPTDFHASPFSLSTSFCGSINTTAVSFLFMFIVYLLPVCSCNRDRAELRSSNRHCRCANKLTTIVFVFIHPVLQSQLCTALQTCRC